MSQITLIYGLVYRPNLAKEKKLDNKKTSMLPLPNLLEACNFGNLQIDNPDTSWKVTSTYSNWFNDHFTVFELVQKYFEKMQKFDKRRCWVEVLKYWKVN
jgi:hypothetical protein